MKKVLKPFKFGTMKTAADFEKTMTEAGLPFPVDENVDILAKPIQIGDKIDMEGFLYWYEGVNPHITSVTAAE